MARKVNKLALKRGEPPIRPIDYTINENGCWIWNWPVSQKGYASVKVGGRTYKAHRLSYEMVYGSIPAGHLIRHLCGNPSCVKPEHLRTGTQTENSRDMVAAGNQHHQKLTRDDATKIRHLITKGNISQVELAKIYNVNPSNISQIISNKTFYDPEYMPPPKYSTRRGGKSREFLVQGEDDENARLPLRLVNGAAPTSVTEQARRKTELRNPNRKPPRKPGEPPIREIDWTLNQETGCQEWRWSKMPSGHGCLKYGREHLAHRVAWITNKGPIPKGHQINHRCNNTSCINVDHLYLGDQINNMRDTVDAGNHANQKLTWDLARQIRNEYVPETTTYQQLGVKYGVTPGAIHRVITNEHYHDPNYESKNVGSRFRRKFSDDQIKSIRYRYKNMRITLSALAREFGVQQVTIGRIIRNETYLDANYTPPSQEEIRLWKLSRNDISAIFSDYENGVGNVKQLAEKYGVRASHIRGVVAKMRGAIEAKPQYRPSQSSPQADDRQLYLL